jgi:hypothetical protein
VDLARWLEIWHNWRPDGAIRGSEEYWMGRLRVDWIINSELQSVASCVTEIEATLPYLMGVHRDSAWATHGCPSRYRVEDVH